MNAKRLILASGSPRRRELLQTAGFQFEVITADVNETPLPDEKPVDYVCRLSKEKAQAIARKLTGDAVILAADTTVVDNDQILGKPETVQEAEQMLTRLRGKVHQVMTGVTLFDTTPNQLNSKVLITDVLMRPYTNTEIAAYIKSGDPFDKAGGYAIQHPGFRPVEQQIGCYSNVVGLPLCLVMELFREFEFIDSISEQFKRGTVKDHCSFCEYQLRT